MHWVNILQYILLLVTVSESIGRDDSKGFTPMVSEDTLHAKQWPFLVHINFPGDSRGNVVEHQTRYCLGSLITRQWVVTAAICVRIHGPGGIRTENVKVGVGMQNKNYKDHSEYYEEYEVEKTVVHPEFVYRRYSARNVALLKLKRKVPKNIALPTVAGLKTSLKTSGLSLSNAKCTVAGWNEGENYMPNDLQEFDITFGSGNYLGKWTFEGKRSRACVGRVHGYGSPLVCLFNGAKVLVGMLNRPIRCKDENTKTKFTNINKYFQWIESARA